MKFSSTGSGDSVDMLTTPETTPTETKSPVTSPAVKIGPPESPPAVFPFTRRNNAS